MKRSEAREMMMQVFFQMEAHKEYNVGEKEKLFKAYKDWKKQSEYVENIFEKFVENREKIDTTIEESSNNWKINRMGKVDLAILRVAVAELLYAEDIPTSVTINEAVNLAKTFGADDSGKFINGILGTVAKQLEA